MRMGLWVRFVEEQDLASLLVFADCVLHGASLFVVCVASQLCMYIIFCRTM